jgi:exosortase D (VPLPA-CTERM-specific)
MSSFQINTKFLWKPVLIAAALAFLYANVLIKLGRDWWTDENYSHGLLVPFVIGIIIWSDFEELKKAAAKPAFLSGFCIILAAIALLAGGTLGAELFTQRISLVLISVGIVVYFFGAKILPLLAAPLSLLVLSIPIPQIIFNKIAFPLQIWASQAAVWGIRLFEVPTLRKGNVIEILPLGSTQIISLEVVEACSGIRSLMTLVTLALILAYFTGEKRQKAVDGWRAFFVNYDAWRALILMASAIPIAVLTNAARVTGTGVLTYYYGKVATESALHDASGWIVYVAALALLIALNTGLKYVFRKGAKAQNEFHQTIGANDDGYDLTNRTAEIKDRKPVPVYLLIGILLLGGLLINWFEQRGEAHVERKALTEISARLGDWRQKGTEIRFGEATESVLRVTDYTMREYTAPDGRLANIYVGYYASQRSGATYHSPQNCLPGAGWVMREPEYIEIKTPRGVTFRANRYIVENGVYKEVLIYWYQGRGRYEASEYADKINTVWDSVTRRRSDGAMVRVMTSVGGDERAATLAAADLSAQIADNLFAFIPE